ncbi:MULTISPECIES: MBL fold metallo-hydrolase [Prochlorococcus]|uniref:MBL fold metallo-hydrolase n=1 Tax=Prochlorococcus TaxID=1218 RepID=UPI000533970A|nr:MULTISPECIES: MBL fold metallo-hydrolase [Prochlorococcus]KGG12176.1 Inactivated Zn-dependent hydrolase of the beta-lactamase fold [Prochlorococcus sp. MIT 0601]
MTFNVTYYGSSGWLLEIANFRILVDPWLVGTLSFPPGKWLFEGNLNTQLPIPDNVNLILLTQGLADHAHLPTLALFDRSIEVVASPSGSEVVTKIGFQKVNILKPTQYIKYNALTIEATQGASVPKIENGYLLTHPDGSLYIEPHGFLDKNIGYRKLDAVITPVLDLKLPLAGNFINGKTILPRLIEKFEPKTILSSTTGGDSTFKGFINKLITIDGSLEEASKSIPQQITFINPTPGKKYVLNGF